MFEIFLLGAFTLFICIIGKWLLFDHDEKHRVLVFPEEVQQTAGSAADADRKAS
jgi:hypothetical protein